MSRTTAYRYFPTQKSLLVAAHPETVATTLVPEDAGDDPEARLLGAVEAFVALIVDTEPQQRTMLRLSLEPDPSADALPLRQGRAIGWFEEALAPLRPRLGPAGVHRLAVTVRSAVGIESLVWLTDVAGPVPPGGHRADAVDHPRPAGAGPRRRRRDYFSRLTPREMASTESSSAVIDSAAINSLARGESGIVSVGLNAEELVTET